MPIVGNEDRLWQWFDARGRTYHLSVVHRGKTWHLVHDDTTPGDSNYELWFDGAERGHVVGDTSAHGARALVNEGMVEAVPEHARHYAAMYRWHERRANGATRKEATAYAYRKEAYVDPYR